MNRGRMEIRRRFRLVSNYFSRSTPSSLLMDGPRPRTQTTAAGRAQSNDIRTPRSHGGIAEDGRRFLAMQSLNANGRPSTARGGILWRPRTEAPATIEFLCTTCLRRMHLWRCRKEAWSFSSERCSIGALCPDQTGPIRSQYTVGCDGCMWISN